MPIIITDGTTKVKADPTFDAMRASPRPAEATVWNQIVLQTGALAGVAASNSTGTIFSLRQIDSASVLMIRRIGLSWLTTTGFTAAQYVDFGVSVARSFSASDTGGTAFSSASNNAKLRTSLSAFTSIDMRMATTAALGAGTRTVDTNVIAQAGVYSAAATAGVLLPMTYVFDQPPGDYPLVLAQNEGIIIWPQTALGAGGVGTLSLMLEIAQGPYYG